MNPFKFVADHQRHYGVKRLCTIVGVARSSFYYGRRTAADRAVRQVADAALAARIRAVHRESDGTYGVPRITAELREDGERVNHKRIARLMRAAGLAGVRLRHRHRTTIADPAAAKAPDLIGRAFTAREPNRRYVGDITYLPLEGGRFLYLATVIDLAARRVEGRPGDFMGDCPVNSVIRPASHPSDQGCCNDWLNLSSTPAPPSPTPAARPASGSL